MRVPRNGVNMTLKSKIGHALNLMFLILILLTASNQIRMHFLLNETKYDQPVVGEVWEFGGKSARNPFNSETAGVQYKVIGVDSGYMEYVNVETGEIQSSLISFFCAGSTKVD